MEKWSKAGTGITINDMTLTKTGTYFQWQMDTKTAYGSKQIKSGMHKWRIKVLKGKDVLIGISSNAKYAEEKPWLKDDTYCYMYQDAGYIHDRHGNKKYPESFGTGDIIEVCVDMDHHKINFIKNDNDSGYAPYDINADATYQLTVSLFWKSDSVKLLSYVNSPSKEEEKKIEIEADNVNDNNFISKSTELIRKQCE